MHVLVKVHSVAWLLDFNGMVALSLLPPFNTLFFHLCFVHWYRELEEFIEPLCSLASSPIYSVRDLASRAILPLLSDNEEVSNMAAKLLDTIPLSSNPLITSQNRLHGILLMVQKLLTSSINKKRWLLVVSFGIIHGFKKLNSSFAWLISISSIQWIHDYDLVHFHLNLAILYSE